MKLRILPHAFLILVLICPIYPASTPLTVSHNLSASDYNSLNPNAPKHYSLATSGLQPTDYLFVLAVSSSNDPLQLPSLEVWSEEKNWACDSHGKISACVISAAQVPDILQARVNCVMSCTYGLYAYADKQKTVNMQQGEVVISKQPRSQLALVQYQVPQSLKFTEVAIIANIDNPEKLTTSVAMYANIWRHGDKIPDPPSRSRFDRSGVPIWDEGKGILLKPQHIQAGDKVLLMVYFPQDQTLTLRTKISTEEIKNIFLGEDIQDVLAQKSSQVYHLNLTNPIVNGSIVLKMKKYSGSPNAIISSNAEFAGSTMVAFTQMTTSLFLLTPKKRQTIGMDNHLFIKVFSEIESVYTIGLQINTRDYVWVTDGMAEMSTIQKGEVDNVFYQYIEQLPKLAQQNKQASIQVTIKSNPGAIDFSVRQCGGAQQPQIQSCLLRTYKQYQSRSTAFDISGEYHEHLGQHTYSFSHRLSNCTKNSHPLTTDIYVCYFQIVVWRMKNFKLQTVDYEVEVKKGSAVEQLEEGFPKRGMVVADDQRNYKLEVTALERVTTVKFYLTKISGECYMMISTDKQPKMDDFVGEYTVIKENIKSIYYITVSGYEQSYYTLTAVVERKGDGQAASLAPIILQEGVSQSFTIEPGQNSELKFGIRIADVSDFTVTVSRIKGSYFFEVVPFENGQMLTEKSVVAAQPQLLVTPESIPYPSNNEFVVIVHAASTPASFEIFYSQSQSICPIRPIGFPVSISTKGSETCMLFQITKIEDFEIVLTTMFLDMVTHALDMEYSINQTTNKITSRFTSISKSQLESLCSQSTRDNEKCNLKIIVKNSTEQKDFTLVVQYTSSDILLFDGVTQRVKGQISNQTAKHFYYDLVNQNTLTVLLKSHSQTEYRLVAIFAESLEIAQRKISYPDWTLNPTNSFYISETPRSSLTTLVISSTKIKALTCKKCAMLLSVFKRQEVAVVDFKIEVAQSLTTVTHGQSRYGYVEKDLAMEYEVNSKQNQETVVSLNGVHENCVKMQAYSRLQSSADYTLHEYSNSNPIVFERTEKPLRYLIRVVGMESCTYQISFFSTKKRIIQINQGSPIDITLEEDQKMYFIYENTKNQSFRILSMAQYGQLSLFGKPLKSVQQEDFSSQAADYVFSSTTSSIQIESTSNNFCSSCYYLFEIVAKTNLKSTILLHSEDSSVPLMLNKIVHQTLRKNEFEEYTFECDSDFNVTTNILYGEGEITIMKVQNRDVIFPAMINKVNVFKVKRNLDDQNRQYIVRMQVKSQQLFSYTLIVSTSSLSSKITPGIPSTFELYSSQCFYFAASALKPTISVMIESPSPNFGQMSVKFRSPIPNAQDQQSDYAIQRGENTLLLHLIPQSGVYTVCVQPGENATQISVLVLESGVPMHMQANKEMMVNLQPGESRVFEVYCPAKGWIMIEGLECRGNIDLIGSRDYNRILQKNPEVKFTHAKTGGHYVGRAKVEPGLYFLAVEGHGNLNQSLAILKYSMFFNKNEYPYDIFDVPKDSIVKYKIEPEGGVTFSVNRIIQDGRNIIIQKQSYRIYVSASADKVRQASQCHNVEIFNRTITLNPMFTSNQIKIRLEKDQLSSLITPEQTILYISIVGYIDVKSSGMYQTNQIRYVYNQAEVNLKQAQLTTIQKILYYVGIPLVFGLVVLSLAWKFCVKKIYMADTRLTEDDGNRNGAQPVDTQAATSKVVVGTTVLSSTLSLRDMIKDEADGDNTPAYIPKPELSQK